MDESWLHLLEAVVTRDFEPAREQPDKHGHGFLYCPPFFINRIIFDGNDKAAFLLVEGRNPHSALILLMDDLDVASFWVFESSRVRRAYADFYGLNLPPRGLFCD